MAAEAVGQYDVRGVENEREDRTGIPGREAYGTEGYRKKKEWLYDLALPVQLRQKYGTGYPCTSTGD